MEKNEAMESDNTPNEVESENTPEEAETSLNTQTEPEPSLTKEQKSKIDSFDRLYAENKSLKAKLAKSVRPEEVEEWEAPSDPLEIVKLGKTLKDYNEEETEFIIKNAHTKDIGGIINAEKDEMVQLAIKAKREKVEKEKALNPSTTQSEVETKPTSVDERLKKAETFAEQEKILSELEYPDSLTGEKRKGLNPLTIRNY